MASACMCEWKRVGFWESEGTARSSKLCIEFSGATEPGSRQKTGYLRAMCGIFGYLSRAGPLSVPEEASLKAGRSLRHRGPDDYGEYRDERVLLGCRRLAILDPSRGRQPMTNRDGSIAVVLNGEIYNHLELRRTHLRGERFVSTSDAETLCLLYGRYGARALELLNGMFAFAVWDRRSSTLLCARDPAGQKPFYYADHPDHVVFASEIKAIHALAPETRAVRAQSVTAFFAFQRVPEPHTMFSNIQQL